jgi:hypothetical protein
MYRKNEKLQQVIIKICIYTQVWHVGKRLYMATTMLQYRLQVDNRNKSMNWISFCASREVRRRDWKPITNFDIDERACKITVWKWAVENPPRNCHVACV